MHIQFQGQYNRKTIHSAVELVRNLTRRSLMIRLAILAVLGALLLSNYLFSPPGDANANTRWVSFAISLVVIAFLLLLPFLSAQGVTTYLWNLQKMREPVSGVISLSGVKFNGQSQNEIGWEEFISGHYTPDLIALLTRDGVLCVFPRSFFLRAQDWQAFQEYAQQKIRVIK